MHNLQEMALLWSLRRESPWLHCPSKSWKLSSRKQTCSTSLGKACFKPYNPLTTACRKHKYTTRPNFDEAGNGHKTFWGGKPSKVVLKGPCLPVLAAALRVERDNKGDHLMRIQISALPS
jgi:hypothetical protein